MAIAIARCARAHECPRLPRAPRRSPTLQNSGKTLERSETRTPAHHRATRERATPCAPTSVVRNVGLAKRRERVEKARVHRRRARARRDAKHDDAKADRRAVIVLVVVGGWVLVRVGVCVREPRAAYVSNAPDTRTARTHTHLEHRRRAAQQHARVGREALVVASVGAVAAHEHDARHAPVLDLLLLLVCAFCCAVGGGGGG